jgi:hypothetical protein
MGDGYIPNYIGCWLAAIDEALINRLSIETGFASILKMRVS